MHTKTEDKDEIWQQLNAELSALSRYSTYIFLLIGSNMFKCMCMHVWLTMEMPSQESGGVNGVLCPTANAGV